MGSLNILVFTRIGHVQVALSCQKVSSIKAVINSATEPATNCTVYESHWPPQHGVKHALYVSPKNVEEAMAGSSRHAQASTLLVKLE